MPGIEWERELVRNSALGIQEHGPQQLREMGPPMVGPEVGAPTR
jgi:hypothetical protein